MWLQRILLDKKLGGVMSAKNAEKGFPCEVEQ
jgi:hypothetical protein